MAALLLVVHAHNPGNAPAKPLIESSETLRCYRFKVFGILIVRTSWVDEMVASDSPLN